MGHKKRDTRAEKSKERIDTGKIKFGLRARIMLSVILPLVILLTGVGIYLMSQVRVIVDDLKTVDITSQTQSAANQVDSFFEPFLTGAKIVANADTVQKIFEEVEAQDASFDVQQAENFLAAKAELKEIYEQFDNGIEDTYLVFFKNDQLMMAGGFVSDDSWNAAAHSWYAQLQNSGGNPIITAVFIGDSTGQNTVSIMTGVFDQSNRMIGAAGIDITMDALSLRLSQIAIGEEGYIVVYDNEQNVVYHPNEALLLKNMKDLGYSSEMLTPLKNKETLSSVIEYQRDGVEQHGRTIYLEELDWQVLGCMSSEEFTAEQERASGMVTASFAVCLWLIVVICFFVSSTIVRPLKKLDAVAGRLAQGDLDVEVTATTNDEVGELAANISLVVERLKTYIVYIEEVSTVLDEFGRGNLIFELKQDYVGEFQRLKVAMNHIQEAMSKTLFQIVDAAAQVDNSSSQIADASQSMAQGATEQASAVEELAATVTDIRGKIQIAAENADMANQFTQEAERSVLQSNDYMKDLMTAMDDIQSTSNEINKIIKNIDDIAFQTNILALNAAVEAARAGAAGKGFAVVADEVRNLAAKSAEAAKSTTTLIENSMNAVEIGMKHARATSDAMKGVSEKSAVTARKMQEISAATAEQSAAIEQLSSGIDQIAGVTQTSSATAEETAASSEELSSQAGLMKRLTAQFQMDERFHHQN